MRILVIIPITGLKKSDISERMNFLRSIRFPGTKVHAVQTERGPLAIESRADEEIASPEILRLTKKAEEDGYDAVIIWCGHDPSLSAAREMVDIPVIGPGEAAFLVASMLGKRPVRVDLQGRIGVLETRKDMDNTVQELVREINLKKEEGADAFYMDCLALYGLGQKLRTQMKMPIVDPAEAALKMAEIAVRLGLFHSRLTYPKYSHDR
jgi:allantoin racemase